MNGIQFITDDKGRKTAVVIDLKTHGTHWQDFFDGLIVESRRHEKDVPFEEVSRVPAKRTPKSSRG